MVKYSKTCLKLRYFIQLSDMFNSYKVWY